MPRSGKSNTFAGSAATMTNRTGFLKFHWTFSYEVDLPNSSANGSAAGISRRPKGAGDDLGALVDMALAFAG